jgi:hypothetical protein
MTVRGPSISQGSSPKARLISIRSSDPSAAHRAYASAVGAAGMIHAAADDRRTPPR